LKFNSLEKPKCYRRRCCSGHRPFHTGRLPLNCRVDLDCAEAEQDHELSAGGIARRRAELCDQAMSKLANFRPFEIAEQTLTNNINALERLSDPDPQQAEMLQRLKQALRDLQESIGATRRMLQERLSTPEQ
jgi:hypothetical protein